MWIIQQRYVDVANQRASSWMNLPDIYLSEEEIELSLKIKRHFDASNSGLSFEYRKFKGEVLDD